MNKKRILRAILLLEVLHMNKNYYRILWGCLAVVVIAGGIFYFVGRDTQTQQNTQQTEQATQSRAHQVIINQTPALEKAMAEREAEFSETAEAGFSEPTETQEIIAEAPKTATGQTENTNTQEKKEETKTEEASIFKQELLFAMPLAGNIVMDYSVDHTIYDATLDQYRTNDHISIEAKKGDSVKAAEDGTVESIQTDDERGVTVVINHDNGWQTTYSQLQEDVVVKEGDKVKKGQEIGFVAEPTKYSVALGEHVDFSIAKDGIKLDPKSNVAE